ncbi:hypothetical protein GOARA_069_00010, partial [Gordonia araii NBRC 100433]
LGALAASAINAITKIAPDWSGEAATAAAIRARDHASTMEERAARWAKTAEILDKAAEQIGKLQSEIIRIIDDPVLQHKFDIFDDGQVTVSKDYENDLLRKHLHDQAGFDEAYEKAKAAARL